MSEHIHRDRPSRRRTRRAPPDDRPTARLPVPHIEAALIGMLALTMTGSVMAIGAVHPSVMGAAASASAICLAGALLLGPQKLRELPAVAWVLWGLCGFTLLQLIPLPLGLLRTIAPVNADVWARALMPLSEPPPSFAPISLDPGATWIEVLRWFSYGAVVAASAAVSQRRGLRWALLLVHGVALTAALVTIGHGLAGATHVFGVYEPTFRPQPWHVGPLLNPNNLAGLLNVGVICGLGLLVDDSPPVPRWMLAPGIAAIVAVAIISASRSGAIVLVVGVAAMAAMTEQARRRGRASSAAVRRARWAGASALVFGAALAVMAATEAIWGELLDENAGKLALIGWVAPALGDHLWVGMGRGSFESAFAAYTPAGSTVTFTHAENFVMQWAAEWGTPVAVAAILALGYLLRPRRFGVAYSRVAAAAWLSIVLLACQNLLDLGLEVPALCFVLAALAGGLEGNAGRRPSRDPSSLPERGHSGRALAVSIGALILAAVGTWNGRIYLGGEQDTVHAALAREAAPRDTARRQELRSLIRAAMQRHPAEPYFPLAGALLAWEERDESPMPWLQRALERRMHNGRTHLLLAMVLHRAGARKQALLELRLAIEADPTTVGSAASLATRWTGALEELAEIVPEGPQRAATWDALGQVAQDRNLGAPCDRKALELEPERYFPHLRLASDVVHEREAGGCKSSEEEQRCASSLEEHAAALERLEPDKSDAVQLRARWLAANDQAVEAVELLRRECNSVTDEPNCLQLRVMIASQIDDARIFADAVSALRHSSCLDADRCAEVNTMIGDAHAARGEHGAAVAAYERAIRDRPTNERLLKLASAASAAGLHMQALHALERAAAEVGDTSPEVKARIEELRRKLVEHVVER